MSAVSPYPALVIVLLALGTMGLMARWFKITSPAGRFAPIDGLRGYMAFFVFLHHSALWFFFLRDGFSWSYLPSNLYSHFGSTSVSVFFMITAFLFFGKLIDARGRGIDWLKLYAGRIMRIMPLYLVMFCVLVFIVAALTHYTIQEPLQNIAVELAQWLVFIRPNINGLSDTRLLTAGVTWSLAFEWLFYFTLVLFGRFAFSIRASWLALGITTTLLGFFVYVVIRFSPDDAWWRLAPFPGGILAAFLARNKAACRAAAGPVASACILLFFGVAVVSYYNCHHIVPYILIVAGFQGIACGNDLYGILTSQYSRLLGQISYSIYLLHGMILFVLFRFVLGIGTAVSFGPVMHWVFIAGCSVVVVIVCCMTYKWIELPGMNAGKKWLRRRSPSRRPLPAGD